MKNVEFEKYSINKRARKKVFIGIWKETIKVKRTTKNSKISWLRKKNGNFQKIDN